MGSERAEAAARVLWCGNLSEKAEREVVHELFLQAGPIQRVDIPKDRDGRQRAYAFITFVHEESVPYAVELFRGTRLYDRTLNLQNRGQQRNANASNFPQFSPTTVDDFRAMTYKIDNFQGSPIFTAAHKTEFHDDNRYNSKYNDLGVAGLQGGWASRNQVMDSERSSNRYEPYNRGGGRDRDRHRNNDRDRYESKHRDDRNDYFRSGRSHRH